MALAPAPLVPDAATSFNRLALMFTLFTVISSGAALADFVVGGAILGVKLTYQDGKFSVTTKEGTTTIDGSTNGEEGGTLIDLQNHATGEPDHIDPAPGRIE